jgi:predicted TIM-barrel fold metal-dependent hydrolase
MASQLSVRGATAPQIALPDGAWDCHAHVFGPFDAYPVTSPSRYVPPWGPAADHLCMLDTAGFTHGVLVHGAANGWDNRGTLDAVMQAPQRRHAIAVMPPDTDDGTLARLRTQGVRGLRFTEIGDTLGAGSGSGVLGLADVPRFVPVLHELGWQAHVWAKGVWLSDFARALGDSGVPLVIDHMGMFDVNAGLHQPAFQSLLSLVSQEAAWVKLTPLRVTRRRWSDCEDVRPYHDALLDRAPGRLLWGSDWPYIRLDADLPDVGRQIDLFDRWTPDRELRQRIFTDNPCKLFGIAT